MATEPAKAERTVVAAISLPLIVAGVAAVALGTVWPERAWGLAVVAGAALALAAGRWGTRVAGLAVVVVGIMGLVGGGA